MDEIARYSGCDHIRYMFWFCELPVPPGYHILKRGKAKKDDLVMVLVPPFPMRIKNGTEAKIKGKWESVGEGNVGLVVNKFRSVVRLKRKQREEQE